MVDSGDYIKIYIAYYDSLSGKLTLLTPPVVHSHGSQSGVRGPPGVLEEVPGGTQLNDDIRIQIDPYLFVTLRV